MNTTKHDLDLSISDNITMNTDNLQTDISQMLTKAYFTGKANANSKIVVTFEPVLHIKDVEDGDTEVTYKKDEL